MADNMQLNLEWSRGELERVVSDRNSRVLVVTYATGKDHLIILGRNSKKENTIIFSEAMDVGIYSMVKKYTQRPNVVVISESETLAMVWKLSGGRTEDD